MLPLEGIKVLDFGSALFGSHVGQWLGDLGADVIKIEPIEGEFARLTSGTLSESVLFHASNRSKKSLAVNLRESEGREIVLKLAKDADVISHNFRVGVMQGFGLDYESIRKINPRIVYGSFSMYGDTGPLAHRRGGDHFAQAISGIVASQGSPEGPPYLAGHPFIDYGAAVIGTLAIVSALFLRDRTGVGQEVTNSLLNTAMFMQTAPISTFLIQGVLLKKAGRGSAYGLFPYGAYPAKDGDVVTIFGQDDTEWPVFCSILGIEHLLSDARYDTEKKRLERKFELYPILDEAFRKKTRREWEHAFKEKGLRCDACLDYAELVAHPQFEASGIVVEVDHPRDGKMKMIGNPMKFKGTPLPHHSRPAPVLGEHTRDILIGLGYSKKDIEGLHDHGVVGIAATEMLHPTNLPRDTEVNMSGFSGRGINKRMSKATKKQAPK